MTQHQAFLPYGPQPAPGGGGGGGTITNAALSSSTTNTLQVVLADVPEGHSIAVSVHWYDPTEAATITSITCSGESAFTVHGSRLADTGSGLNFLQCASLAEVTAAGSKTITVTLSGNVGVSWGLYITATAFAGADVADFLEAIGTGTGPSDITGQTVASATATAAENNSILFFAANATFFGNEGTPNAGGLTQLHDSFDANPGDPGAGGGFAWAGINLDAGSAGSKTGSITMTDEDNWNAVLLIFNPA